MNIGNYAQHASYWDWSGYDRSEEFHFWLELSKTYGKKVLSPMAAIGEVGAHLAKNGIQVKAFDVTKEMVEVGRERYKKVKNFTLVEGNILDFQDEEKAYDFAFIGTTDLHHLHDAEHIKKALKTIHAHLRPKGGLGLELWYPAIRSWSSDKRTFKSLKQNEGMTVWKEGISSYNAKTKRVHIHQVIHTEQDGVKDSFTHEFELQLFSRDWFLSILPECGFRVKAEYGDFSKEKFTTKSIKWLLDLEKSK